MPSTQKSTLRNWERLFFVPTRLVLPAWYYQPVLCTNALVLCTSLVRLSRVALDHHHHHHHHHPRAGGPPPQDHPSWGTSSSWCRRIASSDPSARRTTSHLRIMETHRSTSQEGPILRPHTEFPQLLPTSGWHRLHDFSDIDCVLIELGDAYRLAARVVLFVVQLHQTSWARDARHLQVSTDEDVVLGRLGGKMYDDFRHRSCDGLRRHSVS